jgi:hypothetical protein
MVVAADLGCGLERVLRWKQLLVQVSNSVKLCYDELK